MTNTKHGLGRGLQGLINNNNEIGQQNNSYIPNLDVSKIVPNTYQPRLKMDDVKLQELAISLKENGIIEPLIVTAHENNTYELIAGERRWRAAQLAGITTVPVVIREASPQQMLELAIVENVQRQDLNALEEAMAFKSLREDFHMGLEEIAYKVGKDSTTISNKIRILNLPEEVRRAIIDGIISEGHARALLGIKNEPTLILAFHKVVNQSLSVRNTEELARRLNLGVKHKFRPDRILLDSKSVKYEQNLKTYFNNDTIKMYRSSKGSRIEMKFKNDEEVEQFMLKVGII